MTTPHRTLQMALDALDAITDDVDGTGLNTMPSFDKALDAITALREALAAPEPEPVALESVHLTRDTKGMCVVRVNGRVAIRDNGDIIDHMATLEWFAAPPAAPAVPLQGGMDNNELLAAWQKKLPGRTPEGQELSAFAVGTEVGFEHAQRLERMDWDRVHHVLAKHGKHPGRTDDHLADVIDKALSAAPPAAPALAAPVPDGWVMVPKEATREMCVAAVVLNNGNAVYKNVAAEALEIEEQIYGEVWSAMIAASPAAPAAPVVPLTDEQIDKILERERMKWATSPPTYEFAASFARAIEAALGITGGSNAT